MSKENIQETKEEIEAKKRLKQITDAINVSKTEEDKYKKEAKKAKDDFIKADEKLKNKEKESKDLDSAINDKREKSSKLNIDISHKKGKLDEVNRAHTESSSKLDTVNKNIEEAEKKYREDIKIQSDKLRAAKENFKTSTAEEKKENEELKEKNQTMRDRNIEIEKTQKDLIAKTGEAEIVHAEKLKSIDALKTEAAVIKKTMQDNQTSNLNILGDIESNRKRLVEISDSMKEKEAKLTAKKTELDKMTKKILFHNTREKYQIRMDDALKKRYEDSGLEYQPLKP